MVGVSLLVGVGVVLLFKSFLKVNIPGGAFYALFPEAVRNFLINNF